MFRCRALSLVIIIMSSVISAGFAQELLDSASGTSSAAGSATQSLSSPYQSRHVVVVMEENRSVNQALQYMPYLRSLAQQYSEGMQVYSDSHGSWLAYGELTSGLAPFQGSGDGGICNGDGCSQVITIDNLVRHFSSQGISWKGYFQSMPSIGWMGYELGPYVRRHNPFPFYNDVAYRLPEQRNMVPAVPYMLQDIVNDRLA